MKAYHGRPSDLKLANHGWKSGEVAKTLPGPLPLQPACHPDHTSRRSANKLGVHRIDSIACHGATWHGDSLPLPLLPDQTDYSLLARVTP